MKPEELICKAQRKDNGEWIEGFYFCLHHNDGRTHLHHLIIPLEADLSRGTPLDQIQVEVVPESITLKALQPRLMTLEEAKKRDISYVELRAEDYILPCIVGSPGDGDVIQVKPQLEGFNRIFPRRDYYGKYWRCWTSRPTEEQREAVKWE